MTAPILTFRRCLLLAVSVVLSAQLLWAQEIKTQMGPEGKPIIIGPDGKPIMGPDGKPIVMGPDGRPVMPGAPPSMGPRGPKSPGPPGKPGEGAKPDDPSKPIQRPEKPDTPPNPKELKVGPDKKGEFKFSFNGQPWLGVLQWLADNSKMTLEWQEIPGGYLNLTTQRSYKLHEVRDMFNRRLLDRGYTLLCQGETLMVVNISKLDPTRVPRVQPEELDKRDPHEFVKVSFPLNCLTAETAARELAPMKSNNGKLTPMVDANRVEAMDTVVNLQEMFAVLEQEQSVKNQRRFVRKFKLDYARADDVVDELKTLVGGDSKSPAKPQSPEEAQRAAMMRAMQAAQGGQPGQPGQPPGAPPSPKMGVAFVVNQRENSILVTAPPDKMAMIVQVIKAIDVSTDHDQSAPDLMSRTEIYRLVGIDPEPVVKTLEEIGNLSPTHHLDADKKNKLIIADGTPADHKTIRALVDKLSGSDRSFEVIRLHKLRADAAAGSIEFLMGTDKKKKKETHRWWNPWDDNSSNDNEKSNEFRVAADIEHNRLLLWASEVELRDVQNLLVKLGEVPPKDSGDKIKRVVIDGGNAQETKELLERIRAEWSAPNSLNLPPPASNKGKTETAPRVTNPETELPSKTTAAPPVEPVIRLAEFRRDATAEEAVDRPGKTVGKAPAPVDVRMGADGKLVVTSQDAQALDLFEELVGELAAPRKDYTKFRLHHASALNVVINLEDFFKDEPKKNKVNLPYYIREEYGIDDNDLEGGPEEGQGLSKRQKLKFIPDSDANIILVKGANAAQLKTIAELIDLYDQKPPTDSEMSRQTDIFYLRHSKAKAVYDTIKEVFRDLLSENDKALASNQPRGRRRPFSIFGGFDESGDETAQKVPTFKGSLSIGIDETSNALVVSAPTYVFRDVRKMIKDLDKVAEANNTVRVVKISKGVSAARLREIIDALQGRGSSGGASPAAPTPPHQPGGKRGPKPPNGGAPGAGHNSGGD